MRSFLTRAGGDEEKGPGGEGVVEAEGRGDLAEEFALARDGAGKDGREEEGGGEIGEEVWRWVWLSPRKTSMV